MTIFRISPQDGSEEEIQMRQVRKGDVFHTCDGNNKGPLLQAETDADQRPHPRKPGQFVWGCKVGTVDLCGCVLPRSYSENADAPPPNNRPASAWFRLATCVGCGCNDLRACWDDEAMQPCHWVRLDRMAGLGMCSCCKDLAQAWDSGDRVIRVPVEMTSTP